VSLVPDAGLLEIYLRNWWGIAGFIASLVVVHILRAYRWLYLLRPLSGGKIGVAEVIAIAFAGFMAIMVLPLRTGEVARPYLIGTRGQVSMSAAFATIAIERVIDGLILSAILSVCLLGVSRNAGAYAWVETAGILTLALFVTAFVVLVLMLWKGGSVVDALERFGRRFSRSLAERIAGVLRDFLAGLAALPDTRHVVPFVAMSLVYWGVNALGMWVLAVAGGLPLSLLGGFAVMSILGVGILLPTGPGHFGNFQAAVTVALGLEGVDASLLSGPGSAYVFVLYVGMLGLTVGAGVLAMTSRHVQFGRLVAPAPTGVDEASPAPTGPVVQQEPPAGR
jgi:hypothetical protein